MTTWMRRPVKVEMLNHVNRLGKRTAAGIAEVGYVAYLFVESVYWLIFGRFRKQPVRLSAIFHEARLIGVDAVPILSVLSFAVGIMLAIQGIYTLQPVGAEHEVVALVALIVTREFSPLIVGILVAGRSGSAITARIGTMLESQEIDALRVIGINPIRYLSSPVLVAMMIMVPMLTILADMMAIFASGLYTAGKIHLSLDAYMTRTYEALVVDDIRQGLLKSMVFAVIIAMVGVSNGFQVGAGAEGVGRSTTRSVVLSISFIVLADMVFTYFLNR